MVGHRHHDAQRVEVVVRRVRAALVAHRRRSLQRRVRARHVDAPPLPVAEIDALARRSMIRMRRPPTFAASSTQPGREPLQQRPRGRRAAPRQRRPRRQDEPRVLRPRHDLDDAHPRAARRSATRSTNAAGTQGALLAVRPPVGVVVVAIGPEVDVNRVGLCRDARTEMPMRGRRPAAPTRPIRANPTGSTGTGSP